MSYEIGQTVVIRRNLGRKNGNGRSEYYHSGSTGRMPLGTKGVVVDIDSTDKLLVETGKGGWYVHPDELMDDNEKKQQEKEIKTRHQKELENFLSDVAESTIEAVRSTSWDGEPAPIHGDEGVYSNQGWMRRAIEAIERIFNPLREGNSFEPKFNPREEFVVWVREEFPELDEHSEREKEYAALTKRKEEVLDAAKKAYEHALKTTNSCVYEEFRIRWGVLSGSNKGSQLARSLHIFLRWAEHVSANLGGDVHYGTYYKNSRRHVKDGKR